MKIGLTLSADHSLAQKKNKPSQTKPKQENLVEKTANCSPNQENGNVDGFKYHTVTIMTLIVHSLKRKAIDKRLLKQIYL